MISALFQTLLISFLLASCSFVSGDSLPKSKSYDFKFSHPQWKSIAPDSSDVAYQNPSTKSIMMLNSQCKKYDSSTLETLSSNLYNGISGLTTIDKKHIQFAGRDAQLTKASGRMDGVNIYLRTLTLLKDRCLYDLVLIASDEKNLEKDSKAFDQMMEGFNP